MHEVPELDRLREVCVRKVWSHEAATFTPWLSRNLDYLTETLGIKLNTGEKREAGRNA